MFSAVGKANKGLSVQLCWFRGDTVQHSRWHKNPIMLKKIMQNVSCIGGYTQIARAFRYTAEESQKKKIDVVIYVGDSCEEYLESVLFSAQELKKTGSKLFMLDDKNSGSRDMNTYHIFHSICKKTGGIYTKFDTKAIKDLKEFFKVSAVYATGGKKAVRALPESPKTNLGRRFVQNILSLK